jgi:hypothetical protein
MKILSIDVGMKNLAFCYISVENKNLKIIKWDIIDLCENDKYICMGKNKKNVKCNKNAKFEKNKKFYCKIHAKNYQFKIPNNEQHISKIKKYKFSDLKSLANKYDISHNKKNKSICLNQILTDLSNNYFNFIEKTKATDKNLVEYGIIMKKKFNETLLNDTIDIVLIENQIGPLALRMKTLQGMIMQHFIENNINKIYEISAANKLKEFISLKKTTYNERKKASILFTNKILIELNKNNWISFFKTHKKQDDLADSFLQARWYLKKNNYI